SAGKGYGTVRITLAPDGPDRIVLTVEDDGPGIPESLHAAIFRPFYTTKPPGKGTGLGLSISAGIMEAHGGRIPVESPETGGARSGVVLPSVGASDRMAAPAPSQPVEGGSAATSTDIGGLSQESVTRLRRVLLVDDEAGIRRSVSRLLRRCGFQVTD